MKTYTIIRTTRGFDTVFTVVTDYGDDRMSERVYSSMEEAVAAKEQCEDLDVKVNE